MITYFADSNDFFRYTSALSHMFPGEITLHTTIVNPGGRTLVIGSSVHHYMLAFLTNYSMEPVEAKFPIIMMDETGTMWNIFGEGMMGLHDGETLESPLYYTASDWAWREARPPRQPCR